MKKAPVSKKPSGTKNVGYQDESTPMAMYFLRQKVNLFLDLIEAGRVSLQDLSEDYRKNRDLVLCAVKVDGNELSFAKDYFGADREIVLAALDSISQGRMTPPDRHVHWGFGDIPMELLEDHEVVLAILKAEDFVWESTFSVLRFVPDHLKKHRDIVLAALSTWGAELQHVPEPLRSDREMVLKAMTTNGLALQYAPQFLLDDLEIVRAAIDESLRKPAFMSIDIFLDMVPVLNNHRVVVLEAVSKDSRNFAFVSDELKRDKEIVLAAIQSGSYKEVLIRDVYRLVPAELQGDFEVVVAAVVHGLEMECLHCFHTDGELQRISKHALDARAKRRWERVRVYVERLSIVNVWMEMVAKNLGAAHFDEDGEVVIVGRDAKRQKLEFEEMGVSGS